jgi:hypothetical protein
MPEAGSTKHENPPLPPFGKGGMGGFSYKNAIEGASGNGSSNANRLDFLLKP